MSPDAIDSAREFLAAIDAREGISCICDVCDVEEWLGSLLAHIGAQAAQIEALKKEADCSDIVQALEDAGIPMGDGEQCQDIITAIEILGSRIESLKEKLVEERSDRILRRQHDYEHNYSFTKSDALDLARQQLKAEMPEVGWE